MAGYGIRTADNDPKKQNDLIGELYAVTKTADPFSENDYTILVDQNDGKGICEGDSGSPGYIFDSSTNQYYVAGILSGYSYDVDGGKTPQANCTGIARYSSIMQPEIKNWINNTISTL